MREVTVLERALDWRPGPAPWPCWRCNTPQSRSFDALCPGCVAWLNGSTTIDPRQVDIGGYPPPASETRASRQERFRSFVRQLHRGAP